MPPRLLYPYCHRPFTRRTLHASSHRSRARCHLHPRLHRRAAPRPGSGRLTFRGRRRYLRTGVAGKGRRSGGAARTHAQRRAARAGRRRAARDHGACRDLLESRQSGDRRLHREGDVHRAQVHEPERPSPSLRRLHRGQRPRHGPREPALLRGVWERERHRARVRPTAVSDERAWGRVQRRGAQGGRAGEARHAGDRAVGQGRQGRMHGEWHGRREL